MKFHNERIFCCGTQLVTAYDQINGWYRTECCGRVVKLVRTGK